MELETKITIIEGPPPVFEMVEEGWSVGVIDSPILSDIAITRLRTYNGPALVERCHRAWRHGETMFLEFRTMDGLTRELPIVAVRNVELEEGAVLFLWVRIENDDIELELDYEDDADDEDLDFPDFLD